MFAELFSPLGCGQAAKLRGGRGSLEAPSDVAPGVAGVTGNRSQSR